LTKPDTVINISVAVLDLILQGYFGYENDRTHVIKVVVLVVKITIRLTYGIHVFKKKEHTTTIVYLMAMSEPQESSHFIPCLEMLLRTSHVY
jgi:hypothetical protein